MFNNKIKNNYSSGLNKILIFLSLVIFLFLAIFLLKEGSSYSFSRLVKKIKNEKPEPVIIYREEVTVKVLEGWMNANLDNHLRENFFLDWEEDDFLKATGHRRIYNLEEKQSFSVDWSNNFDFLSTKPDNLSLEGYLFPDTYRFFASSSPEEVVSRMLTNFGKKVTAEMLLEIEKQGKTLHEIITMASIIEKEAPIFNQTKREDARLISGIFWNRLKIGMALQSDATLSYIFENKKPAHSGDELKVDSPYNTYRYRGLPPGPICNPGLISIEAAIYPQESDYLFFLTPLDGSRVHYAKNYQDHLSNKYKYLK